MQLKWKHLFESDETLRKLERIWRESESDEDMETYIKALERAGKTTKYSWDNYTHPLYGALVKLLKRKRRRVVYGPRQGRFDESRMGYYKPTASDEAEAKVVVRSFRAHDYPEDPTLHGGSVLKTHLYGRIHVEMEFGRLTRGRLLGSPRQWRCDGRVILWVIGPETNWSDFETGVPNQRHKVDVKMWKAKELLRMLYSKMHKACDYSNLYDQFGFKKGTYKLKVPEHLEAKYRKRREKELEDE